MYSLLSRVERAVLDADGSELGFLERSIHYARDTPEKQSISVEHQIKMQPFVGLRMQALELRDFFDCPKEKRPLRGRLPPSVVQGLAHAPSHDRVGQRPATCHRMGLGAWTVVVGVLGTFGDWLVARGIHETVRGFRCFGHGGVCSLGPQRQLPLSLAVGFWWFGWDGRGADRLRKGQAWPLRRWSATGLPSLGAGRKLIRLAFGSFASWIIEYS
jgi:hypothetical protein